MTIVSLFLKEPGPLRFIWIGKNPIPSGEHVQQVEDKTIHCVCPLHVAGKDIDITLSSISVGALSNTHSTYRRRKSGCNDGRWVKILKGCLCMRADLHSLNHSLKIFLWFLQQEWLHSLVNGSWAHAPLILWICPTEPPAKVGWWLDLRSFSILQ